MSSSSASPSSSSRNSLLMLGVGLIILVVLLIIGWRLKWGAMPVVEPDKPVTAEVLELNNRGVGFMEQFEYADAARLFEQVVEKAPDWIPGQVNLGIAVYNQG